MGYQNASEEQIVTALRAGQSVNVISRELRADRARVRRIRDKMGIARCVPAAEKRTLEEKWAQHTRSVDGGHLEWTGERGTAGGSPVLRYRQRSYSPTAVAFKIRTGRDATGYVIAQCGMRHCVAPEHVQDETERAALRAAARPAPEPEACRHGHPRTEFGRYTPTGAAYCERCKLLDKHPETDDRTRRVRPASLEEAFSQYTRQTDGGHLVWTGPTYRGGPGLPWAGTTHSPMRIAFRLHHGRQPEGNVTRGCAVPHCVAGPCLRDQAMRAADREAARAEQRVNKLYDAIFGSASEQRRAA